MGKNVTCLLEPLTFEPIRSTIWNVAVNAEQLKPAAQPQAPNLLFPLHQGNGVFHGTPVRPVQFVSVKHQSGSELLLGTVETENHLKYSH